MNVTLFDNRYRLLELLGSGTTAKVYRALDQQNDTEVALKVFDESYLEVADALKLFEREIKAVARLENHPNLLTYYGGSLKEGCRYLVMEIATGETLMHYLNRQGGKLSLEMALSFYSQLLSALSYIHKRGVIHRDIKPQNIRISSDGRLKLCDFGIAVVIGADPLATGKAVGTVNYISPEQAKGIEVSPASDLYSAGIVLYEMLTGQLPFTSDKMSSQDRIDEIIRKHLKETPIRPTHYNPNIPDALEGIILKSMSKNPSSRFQNADEILRYLALYRQNPSIVFDFELPDDEFDSGAVLPKNTDPLGFKPKNRVKERTSEEKETTPEVLTRKKLLLITLFFSLSLIAALVIYFALDSLLFFESHERTLLTKGDLLYQPYQESLLEELSQMGYDVTTEYEYSPYYPSGTIIAQHPFPQAPQELSKDQSPVLHLTISTDQAMMLLEDFRLSDYRRAKTELESLGFSVTVKKTASNLPAGQVIDTTPSFGEIVTISQEITLLVSSGESVKYAYMPNLFGKSIGEAKAALQALGIRYEVVYAESDLPYGTVIYQSRPYGEKLPIAYYTVLIHVSNTVSLPDTTTPPESTDITPESQIRDIER